MSYISRFIGDKKELKPPKKLGSDGGLGSPYIINPYEKKQCQCCGRMEELRMGVCWDCATCESIIGEGIDMYEKPIPRLEGYSEAMSKLRFILKTFMVAK